MNNLYNKVKEIVSPVYLVGGSVRDKLLGKEPKDYDFTTPLLPETIEQKIKESGRKVYLIGKRFGTIGFKIDGDVIELTSFRTEKYREGNRKPDVIFVGDLEADLSRRDFTINAMAMDDETLHDPFGGEQDLVAKVIRCVGKPSERFKEDPLRMLRAGRFASQLGFSIEEVTFDMCAQLNYKILEISKERWGMELDKILLSDNPSIGLDFLMNTRLMNFMIPEIALQLDYDQTNSHHSLTLWKHTKKVVEATPKDIELRWSALLHDMGKPFVRRLKKEGHCSYHKHDMLGKEMVLKLATYLKWSNNRKDNISHLVFKHMDEDSPLKDADRGAK